ncbi:putative disrupter of telomere silencing protein [Lasiodiplodia theobromae]|uniref:thioredoxin-dependent peroxiredoxin n=1 Tax=Lasiodiplodia theobromae TaxID=45133 RepID=A0A5N5DBT8_9PEZI|nr:Peroxiredoxin [Lasiodiplodia theobromae]KAF9637117.1 putative disrupter of telomere silencing protein [Lasiodiplodia theobromae]
MVELRKRKTPPPAPEKAAKRKPGPKSKAAKAKEAVTDAVNTAAAKADKTVKKVEESATNGASSTATKPAGKPEVGATLELDGFGGEIETNDGTKTTLKKLVDESKDGVVLFTYPKASTPGCTKQACLFRDSYTPLTATGLSIFGLSSDSPKANTTFKTKQNLPYPLLCDPSFGLIRAIGLAKPGNAKGTVRGVFVVDKSGKVLAAEAGGPDATVEVVKKIVAGKSGGDNAKADEKEKQAEDKKQAETAGEVADAAAEAGVDGEGK